MKFCNFSISGLFAVTVVVARKDANGQVKQLWTAETA